MEKRTCKRQSKWCDITNKRHIVTHPWLDLRMQGKVFYVVFCIVWPISLNISSEQEELWLNCFENFIKSRCFCLKNLSIEIFLQSHSNCEHLSSDPGRLFESDIFWCFFVGPWTQTSKEGLHRRKSFGKWGYIKSIFVEGSPFRAGCNRKSKYS